MIMFRQPTDIETFEDHYNNLLALIERMPLIQRRQVIHSLGSPSGIARYYRILEIYFTSEADLRQALGSPQGQESAGELSRFETDFDLLMAEVFEEMGGSTAQGNPQL
ncbi:hypothetical protein MASR2M15_22940 [Anaerolineales bacterium]